MHLDTSELSVCVVLIRPRPLCAISASWVSLLPVSACHPTSMPTTLSFTRGGLHRHVAWTVVGCCFRQVRLIRVCIKSLPLGAAKAAVDAFVTSRVARYKSLLAGAPACLLDGLQSAQCCSEAHLQQEEV